MLKSDKLYGLAEELWAIHGAVEVVLPCTDIASDLEDFALRVESAAADATAVEGNLAGSEESEDGTVGGLDGIGFQDEVGFSLESFDLELGEGDEGASASDELSASGGFYDEGDEGDTEGEAA